MSSEITRPESKSRRSSFFIEVPRDALYHCRRPQPRATPFGGNLDSATRHPDYRANLSAARAFAFAASSSRFFGGAFVSSALRRLIDTAAISSTAARNEASFAFDGLLKPVILRTNCNAAARVSSSVTGGSKLKSVLMFLHIALCLTYQSFDAG